MQLRRLLEAANRAGHNERGAVQGDNIQQGLAADGHLDISWKVAYSLSLLKADITDPGQPGILEHDTPGTLFRNERERQLFQGAYPRALMMFFPVEFAPSENTLPPFHAYNDFQRFPFLDDDKYVPRNKAGRIKKFQIPKEYLAKSVEKRTRQLPRLDYRRG